MGEDLIGRRAGMDLDDDGEQAGHYVRFARRADFFFFFFFFFW